MIEKIRNLVIKLLGAEGSGHGMDHVERVFKLAMRFAENEVCNKEIVAVAVLLHDVDDYKIFGTAGESELPNATRILSEVGADETTKEQVLDIIKNMGYSKYLKGIRPKTIEGMIVSDADMCDAIGANGILRTYKYNIKHGGGFFDRNIWPVEDFDSESYKTSAPSTAVCHMFEKMLKIKGIMMTESGKKEAEKRQEIMIDFLKQIFSEEDANDWLDYLDNYLKNL